MGIAPSWGSQWLIGLFASSILEMIGLRLCRQRDAQLFATVESTGPKVKPNSWKHLIGTVLLFVLILITGLVWMELVHETIRYLEWLFA